MSESKLIRVEDLEKIYQDRIDYFVEKGMETGDPDLRTIAGAVNGCLRIAKELVPTVDAVEVVRCKDCKYALQYDETYWCTREDALDDDGDCVLEMGANSFCSFGERKGRE